MWLSMSLPEPKPRCDWLQTKCDLWKMMVQNSHSCPLNTSKIIYFSDVIAGLLDSNFWQLLETLILVQTVTESLKMINKFPGNTAEDNGPPKAGCPEQGALQPASDATPLPAGHAASHGPAPGLPLTHPQPEPARAASPAGDRHQPARHPSPAPGTPFAPEPGARGRGAASTQGRGGAGRGNSLRRRRRRRGPRTW